MGSKFFPFRIDSFSDWKQNNFVWLASPENISAAYKMEFWNVMHCWTNTRAQLFKANDVVS